MQQIWGKKQKISGKEYGKLPYFLPRLEQGKKEFYELHELLEKWFGDTSPRICGGEGSSGKQRVVWAHI